MCQPSASMRTRRATVILGGRMCRDAGILLQLQQLQKNDCLRGRQS